MTSTPQVKRHHHQVSQFYLARFASPKTGQVWNYDKVASEAWPRSVEDTAVESHLYSFTMGDGQRNTELEDVIARTESRAAPLLQRVCGGEELSGSDREAFASFVALTFVRTNAFRRLYAELFGNIKMARDYIIASDDEIFETQMVRFQADCGPISEEQKRKLRADMLDPSQYTILVDREYTLRALKHHDQLAPLISSMKWTIMEAPEGDWRFIASDNPVVQWIPPEHRPPFGGRGGFRHQHTEVHFPLSPTLCWVGHWRQEMPWCCDTTTEWVKQTNRITAEAAERFLYSHVEREGLRKLAKKYVSSQLSIHMGGGPASNNRAEIKVVRSLSRSASTNK